MEINKLGMRFFFEKKTKITNKRFCCSNILIYICVFCVLGSLLIPILRKIACNWPGDTDSHFRKREWWSIKENWVRNSAKKNPFYFCMKFSKRKKNWNEKTTRIRAATIILTNLRMQNKYSSWEWKMCISVLC